MIDWQEYDDKRKELATLGAIRELLEHGFNLPSPSLGKVKFIKDEIQQIINGLLEADENHVDHEQV